MVEKAYSESDSPTGAQVREALNEKNQYFIVEVIRNVAEYSVYSERFNRLFVEMLIEKNVF